MILVIVPALFVSHGMMRLREQGGRKKDQHETTLVHWIWDTKGGGDVGRGVEIV